MKNIKPPRTSRSKEPNGYLVSQLWLMSGI
jgi:hypothetical protein